MLEDIRVTIILALLLEKAIPGEKSTLHIYDLFKSEEILMIRNPTAFLSFLSRSAPSVCAARAADPQPQAKAGMRSGPTTSHCATTVPNSLLKVPPGRVLSNFRCC